MQCEVTGKIVEGLQLSACREQYEQLLQALSSAAGPPAPPPAPSHQPPAHGLHDVSDPAFILRFIISFNLPNKS